MSIAQNISLCHRHTQPTLSRFVHGRPLGQVTIIRVNTFGAWERQADSEKSPLPAPPSRCLSQFMPHLHESVPSASRGCGPSQSPFQRGAGTHCLRNICGGNSPLLHFPPITLPRESSPDPRFLDYSGLSLPGGHRCHPPSLLFGAQPSKHHMGNGTQTGVGTTAAHPGGSGTAYVLRTPNGHAVTGHLWGPISQHLCVLSLGCCYSLWQQESPGLHKTLH